MTTCAWEASACDREVWCARLCYSHYRKLRTVGVIGLVDGEAALDHVEALRKLGWTCALIEQAAGLGMNTVWSLLKRRTRVRRATALAILRVPLTHVPTKIAVDSAGTRRRIQSLMWHGWPKSVIAQKIGVNPLTFKRAYQRDHVPSWLYLKVKDFFDTHGGKEGPSLATAQKAKACGYFPAQAWDEQSIDDPDAQPNLTGYDEETVRALIEGFQPEFEPQDLEEAIRRTSYFSIAEQCRLFGVDRHLVCERRKRMEAA